MIEALPLTAMAREVALHCVPVAVAEDCWEMVLDESRALLFGEHHRVTIEAALRVHVGRPIELRISAGVPPAATPAALSERARSERHAAALQELRADERLAALMSRFDARLDESSVRPV